MIKTTKDIRSKSWKRHLLLMGGRACNNLIRRCGALCGPECTSDRCL